jgi:hypothetical protein
MRTAVSFAALVLLAACGRAEEEKPVATVENDGRIDCRIGADSQFTRYCRIERTRGEDGTLLTVYKADGGFRRLKTTRDGRGVIAADGAETADVKIVGEDLIEVGIGGDSFRLPARVGPLPQPGK